jgi:hypothetical protein
MRIGWPSGSTCRRGAVGSRSLVSCAARKFGSGHPYPSCSSRRAYLRSRNKIWSFQALDGARQPRRRKTALPRLGHTTEAKDSSRTGDRCGSKKARTRWLDRIVRVPGRGPNLRNEKLASSHRTSPRLCLSMPQLRVGLSSLGPHVYKSVSSSHRKRSQQVPCRGRGRRRLCESDTQYGAAINSLFVQENFAELEKIEQQNRVEKGRVAGGIWKSFSFIAIAVPPGEVLKDSDYDFRFSIAKKWVAAYPNSANARIALANLYVRHGHGVGEIAD